MPVVLVNLLQSTGTKGGIEAYVRELYRAIALSPEEFTFVGFACSELSSKDTSWFPGEIVNSRISGENRFSWARGELFKVSKYAKQIGADLIHGPAMFGPLKTHVPFVLTIHDLLYFTSPHLMKTKAFTGPVKWMETRAAKQATRVLSISESTTKDIEKFLPVPPDAIDTVLLAGRPMLSNSSQTVKRQPDLFIAMGQRSPYKSFETLISAWDRMEPEERPRLIITGSHGKDPLIDLVAQYDLTDSITLKSWVPESELEELMSSATALIDTTAAAGFGMPALEAMARGLPVILSDIPVFREIAGKPAMYFTAQNPKSLAIAVKSLQRSPELLREMSLHGLEWASSFSWQRTAKETLESFRAALRATEKSE